VPQRLNGVERLAWLGRLMSARAARSPYQGSCWDIFFWLLVSLWGTMDGLAHLSGRGQHSKLAWECWLRPRLLPSTTVHRAPTPARKPGSHPVPRPARVSHRDHLPSREKLPAWLAPAAPTLCGAQITAREAAFLLKPAGSYQGSHPAQGTAPAPTGTS
jgi:hypothetical protein